MQEQAFLFQALKNESFQSVEEPLEVILTQLFYEIKEDKYFPPYEKSKFERLQRHELFFNNVLQNVPKQFCIDFHCCHNHVE